MLRKRDDADRDDRGERRGGASIAATGPIVAIAPTVPLAAPVMIAQAGAF